MSQSVACFKLIVSDGFAKIKYNNDNEKFSKESFNYITSITVYFFIIVGLYVCSRLMMSTVNKLSNNEWFEGLVYFIGFTVGVTGLNHLKTMM